MKKVLSLLVLLPLMYGVLRAWNPRITYGLEWGYTATFLKTGHYNFICAEGYRIVQHPDTWRYLSNGSILAGGGLDLTDKLNASLYSGVQGVYSKRWIIPLELRLNFAPSGLHNDGLLCHAGAAVMFPTSIPTDTGLRANLGSGYRFAVFRNISFDVLLSACLTIDHDLLLDPDTAQHVPRWDVTSDISDIWGLNLSFAINF